jgi:hypothetical protein
MNQDPVRDRHKLLILYLEAADADLIQCHLALPHNPLGAHILDLVERRSVVVRIPSGLDPTGVEVFLLRGSGPRVEAPAKTMRDAGNLPRVANPESNETRVESVLFSDFTCMFI